MGSYPVNEILTLLLIIASRSKLLFSMSLIFGIIISISSSSWLMVWIGLEINLLSFIPIISSAFNQYRTEITLKYFLIQALRSSCILVGVLLSSYSNTFSSLIIAAALIIKIGGAPFHFWFIDVIKQLNWLQIIILNTFQKISPIILISYLMHQHVRQNIIILSIIISSLLGGLGGLSQRYLNKIIAYSSLNHIGWILQRLSISIYLWFLYFITYCILLSSICLIFHFFKVKHLKQLINKIGNNFIAKIIIAFPLISLAGLPPFSGFIMKIIVIFQLIRQNQIFVTIILISSSLLRLFFYFRIIIRSIIISTEKRKAIDIREILKINNKTRMIFFFNFFAILFPSFFLVLI